MTIAAFTADQWWVAPAWIAGVIACGFAFAWTLLWFMGWCITHGA